MEDNHEGESFKYRGWVIALFAIAFVWAWLRGHDYFTVARAIDWLTLMFVAEIGDQLVSKLDSFD